jgi:cytosine/adenosine deaminase-related metal-dependent hydrolase
MRKGEGRRTLLKMAVAAPAVMLAPKPSGAEGQAAEVRARQPGAPRERADLLIAGGTVLTMDPARRVIEQGAVAVRADRIVAVGTFADLDRQFDAARRLDARSKVVMPGLIDGHGHAGHGLLKSLGTDMPGEWYQACDVIYAKGSTEDFWRADALLTATERLMFGVTTGVTFFGGGDSVMRTDAARYGDAHLGAVQQVGVRWFLAVGPRRPPFPRTYVDWSGGTAREVSVTFDDQIRVCEELVGRWHGRAGGRVHLAMMFPTHHPETDALAAAGHAELVRQARAARDVSRRHRLLFTQDGHSRGSVKFAHDELGLLGPDALLSHSTDLTDDEIRICRDTNTRIVHNPSAVASIRGRCPATELIDAGVTVMLGSDGVGPDRSYDMFRHMFQAMRYHRFHFRDPSVLPAGKVLEMVTIDAARALGLDQEIGSIEPGKKADLILVDLRKPHLYPFNMPVYRVAYFANGNDVDTVIVDGRVLMERREVKTVKVEEVLDLAQAETEAALRRTQLEHLLAIPERFWGVTRGLA